jgi:CubicO group peptidase (beta-lactamase class C family)
VISDLAELSDELDRVTARIMSVFRTPGLSVAVGRGGEVVLARGYGHADVAAGRSMTPDTTVCSGSMGKVYTATAVMQLVEEGRLALDEPVNRYLTEFQVTNPLGGRDVTVRDLLTHRSGLTGNAAAPDFRPPPPLGEHLAAVYGKQVLDSYGGAAPFWSAPAGEKYQYSNTGIATLGYLVEVANGASFSDYVQAHVLDPLGMSSSQYPPVQDQAHVRPDLYARLSTGYAQIGDVHVGTPPLFFGDFPAGGVVTTPGDHARLLLAYAGGGELDGRRILQPETVASMFEPQVSSGYPGVDTGLVWQLVSLPGKPRWIGHSGAHMWGWTNTSRYYPDLDLVVVVSANHWNVLEGPHAPRYPEGDRVSQLVAAWAGDDACGGSGRSAAWDVSYVRGLVMVDRTKGMLGAPSPLTQDIIRTMTSAAVAADDTWDDDGFRAGVADLLAEEHTPAGIDAFLRSPRCKVPYAELPLVAAELGSMTGALSLPVGSVD